MVVRVVLSIWVVIMLLFDCRSMSAQSELSEKDKLDYAVDTVQKLCLAGKGYRIEISGDGELSILRLKPSLEGSVSITKEEYLGGTDYVDEALRLTFDEKTRECTSAHIYFN